MVDIVDEGDSTVTIEIDIHNTTIAVDGFKLDLEVEEGTSIFDTKTQFAVYEYPEITATLIDSNFDEKFNETQTVVQCDFEGGYVPQHSGSIEPRTTAWLGEYLELEEVNGTFVLFPGDVDIDGELIHGQTASCKYSFDLAENQYSETAETDDRVYYSYLPTSVRLSVFNTKLHNGKNWAKQGTSVDFTCQSNGNPAPELTISLNGASLASGSGQTESGSELNHSGYQVAGLANIECRPDVGEASDSLVIDSHYIFDPVVSNEHNANQTTTKTSRFVFTEGDSATGISCTADSNPPSTTSFSLKNGLGVSLGSKSALALGDSGNYTCTATNELGDVSTVGFELIVEQALDNDTSTGGASIAIIVIVCLLVLVLIAGAAFYIIRQKKENNEENNENQEDDLENASYHRGQPVTAEPEESADK